MGTPGDGTGTGYPAAFDTPETRADGDVITANFQNDMQAIAMSAQAPLGLNPQGTFPSVADRLDAIQQWEINRGQTSIPNGATSVIVTHGMQNPFVSSHVRIMPDEATTNSPGHIWVNSIVATPGGTFTVFCENDPGASGMQFGWEVMIPL